MWSAGCPSKPCSAALEAKPPSSSRPSATACSSRRPSGTRPAVEPSRCSCAIVTRVLLRAQWSSPGSCFRFVHGALLPQTFMQLCTSSFGQPYDDSPSPQSPDVRWNMACMPGVQEVESVAGIGRTGPCEFLEMEHIPPPCQIISCQRHGKLYRAAFPILATCSGSWRVWRRTGSPHRQRAGFTTPC
jgi:hypothetical protein